MAGTRRSSKSQDVKIGPLRASDRDAWEHLARDYKKFYKTRTSDAEFAAAWKRLHAGDDVFALGARLDGQLVGIAHYLFHASTWTPTVCYLQDLFTAPSVRGKGVARALIEAVADAARQRGATRYYWLTQEHNAVARVLYNKIATYQGFIRYDYPLAQTSRVTRRKAK
jgi:GNAT superfamily N-acetyltransferase